MRTFLFLNFLILVVSFFATTHISYSQNCTGCTTTITTSGAANLTINSKVCFNASGGDIIYTGSINLQNNGMIVICGGNSNTVYLNGTFTEGGAGATRYMQVDGKLVFNDADLTPNLSRAFVTVSSTGNFSIIGKIKPPAVLSTAGFTGSSTLTIAPGGVVTITGDDINLASTSTIDGTLNINGNLTTSSGSSFSNLGTVNVSGNASFSGIYNNHGDWHIGALLSLSGSASSNLTGGRFYTYDLTLTSPTLTADPGGCAAFIVTNNSVLAGAGLNANGNVGIYDLGSPGAIDNVNFTCANGDAAPWNGPGPYCGVIPVASVGSGGSGCFATLPVEWLSYMAKQINDQQIKIEWKTSQENLNAYFTIQRSNDGIDFVDIGKVIGVGNSNEVNEYSFTDNFHYNGIVFYRIVQTDVTKEKSFSDVIVVKCSNQQGLSFDVFPNPSNSAEEINLVVDGLINNSEVFVILMDNIGHSIYSKVYISEKDNILVAIGNEVNLAQGVYFITASSNQSIVTKKLIVN